MVLFRNGTDKNGFRTHFFLSFPTCKRSFSFWNRSASFFPEPVVLVHLLSTVNLMRFTPSSVLHVRIKEETCTTKSCNKAVEPQKDHEVEMLLVAFFYKHFPALSDTLLLRSKFVFSSFEETQMVRSHPLSFEVRSQAHTD